MGSYRCYNGVAMGSDTNKEYGCTIFNNYRRKNSDLSNIRKQIKAFDTDNNDISDYVIISGNFNLNSHGKYQMEIRLIDIYGNDLRKDIELIVTEKRLKAKQRQKPKRRLKRKRNQNHIQLKILKQQQRKQKVRHRQRLKQKAKQRLLFHSQSPNQNQNLKIIINRF